MLIDIIKQIVTKEGEQILSEPKRVNAFFSDLAKDDPKPQKEAIIDCLEHGVVKILKDVTEEERTNCKEKLAQKLRAEEGLDVTLYREAIAILCKVLFETYVERGEAYLEKKQYDEAIINFTDAIRLYPKYGIAYERRGVAYLWKYQYDKAIIDFTEAIRLDPKYADAYYWRGEVYRVRKQYDEAIIDYTDVIRLNPKDAFAYGRRGEVYRQLDNRDQAIRDFEKALALCPSLDWVKKELKDIQEQTL